MTNLGKHFENTEVTEQQLEEINKVLGIEPKKVDILWKPDFGERYFFVKHRGQIDYYLNEEDEIDRKIFTNTKVFKTREDAQFESRKRAFLLFMEKEFDRNSKPIDWKDGNQCKYSLILSRLTSGDEIELNVTYGYQCQGFHTTNRDWLGTFMTQYEEDIKKYYFDLR